MQLHYKVHDRKLKDKDRFVNQVRNVITLLADKYNVDKDTIKAHIGTVEDDYYFNQFTIGFIIN